MFKIAFKGQRTTQTAFCIKDASYSLATISANNTLQTHVLREFTPDTKPTMAQALVEDAERYQLIGQKCHLVLTPKQYQLVLMDAVDVPEQNMAKALKWRLKGLIDYPLNDIAIDAFMIPPHGVAKQQKKAFVAVTLLSKLRAQLSMFEAAYINITQVGIAELALGAICALNRDHNNSPHIVISLEQDHCQLHIFYQQQLYLVRALQLPIKLTESNPGYEQSTLLEIQRSVDYCLSALKIPEPQYILFTPGFHQAEHLLAYLRTEQSKPIRVIDLNELIAVDKPLDFATQHNLFYGIGAALNPLKKYDETTNPDERV